MEKCEEIKIGVTGEQIDRIIEEGPEKAFEIFQEYVQDVQTLTERMHDLYKAEPVLPMFGVKVKVVVSMYDKVAADIEFGCDGIQEALNG